MRLNPRAVARICLVVILGSLYFSNANADVVLFRADPVGLETGFWQASVKREDVGFQCMFGEPRTCYYTYVEIRNASDQTLNCEAHMKVDNNNPPWFETTAYGSGPVYPRWTFPRAIAWQAAEVLSWSAYCWPGPPPPGGGGGGSTSPSPTTPPGSLNIEGSVNLSFAEDNSFAILSVERVANRRSAGTSGTLYLQLFATTSAGSNSGYNIGQSRLGELPAGFGFQNVTSPIEIHSPPPGTYTISVLLSEYPDLNSYVDRVDLNGSRSFSGPSGGGTGGGIPSGSIGLETPAGLSFSVDSSLVTITVTAVRNTRSSGTSGTLYLRLYAVTEPNATAGILIAESRLGELPGGSAFLNINQTVSVTRPPAGTYFFVLGLAEYPNLNTLLYRIDFSGTATFGTSPSPPPPPPPPPSVGSSSGGGGAVDIGMLLILLLLALRCRRPNHQIR